MRFSEPMRMAEGGEGPVWSRQSRRSGGSPIVGLTVTVLALFGALTIGLAIAERSVAKAGARIDGWIAPVAEQIGKLTGQAAEKTGAAGEKAAADVGKAAQDTGGAVKAGVDKTAEELKKPAA